MKFIALFNVVSALHQEPSTGARVPRVNVQYQFSATSRDDVTRLAYAKDLNQMGQQFLVGGKTSLVEQEPTTVADSLTRGSGANETQQPAEFRETLAPIVFMHFNGPKRSFMESKRPVEIKLDPPAVQYPEVQDLIKELDEARDAHERELLNTIQGSKASFMQTLDGDVAVKVEPAAPVAAEVLDKIKAIEATRQSNLENLVRKVLSSVKRVHFVETARGTDIVVKASKLPWKRVASLVDDLESRTDASQQRILDALRQRA